MSEIAVIGDRDSVSVFSAVGFDVFIATSAEKASKTLRTLFEENYAVIYITEKLASQLKKEIDLLKDKTTPAIILIPGVDGNTGEGMKNLSSSVERAVGKNILK